MLPRGTAPGRSRPVAPTEPTESIVLSLPVEETSDRADRLRLDRPEGRLTEPTTDPLRPVRPTRRLTETEPDVETVDLTNKPDRETLFVG